MCIRDSFYGYAAFYRDGEKITTRVTITVSLINAAVDVEFEYPSIKFRYKLSELV